MGKWTLAHTEAQLSDKLLGALAKPLQELSVSLIDFHDSFDPQDPLIRKLLGALVNDVARRRSCPKFRRPTSQRCAEAVAYIGVHPSSPSSHPPATSARRAALRARRRHEVVVTSTDQTESPWRPWPNPNPADDPEPDFAASTASSLNLYDAYSYADPREDTPARTPTLSPPGDESSGEYWWRTLPSSAHGTPSPHTIYSRFVPPTTTTIRRARPPQISPIPASEAVSDLERMVHSPPAWLAPPSPRPDNARRATGSPAQGIVWAVSPSYDQMRRSPSPLPPSGGFRHVAGGPRPTPQLTIPGSLQQQDATSFYGATIG